jgi:hypothetical protein
MITMHCEIAADVIHQAMSICTLENTHTLI